MNPAVEQCDVAVIGGGPGGSTAAALLARRGHKVIALEKAHHPRFHIGESLLPMNLPVFERLGVLDKVRALGVLKPGADFEASNERGYSTYAFARALGGSPPHAYHVWRQDFDKMLYDHAREQRRGRARGPRSRRGGAARCGRIAARCADRRRPRLPHSGALCDRCQRPRCIPVSQEEVAPQEPPAPERGHLRSFSRRRTQARRG